MRDLKQRLHPNDGTNQARAIPQSQQDAVERRHALDEQLRNGDWQQAANGVPQPHFHRSRPPG